MDYMNRGYSRIEAYTIATNDRADYLPTRADEILASFNRSYKSTASTPQQSKNNSGSTKRSYDTYEEQVIAEKVSSYPVWTFSELVDNWNAASKHARKMEELKQKRICIVGKVVRVDKATVFNYPYIKLEDTHRNFWSSPMVIDCDFSHGDNYVFDLDIGDIVVIEGQVGGVLMGTLYLEKCKATARFVSR